jgi:hypothetical protein
MQWTHLANPAAQTACQNMVADATPEFYIEHLRVKVEIASDQTATAQKKGFANNAQLLLNRCLSVSA